MIEIGEEFQVLDGAVTVRVVPIAFSQIGPFASRVGRFLQVIGKLELTQGEDDYERNKRIVGAVLPVVLENSLDLFKDCVVGPDDFNFERVPHWEVPPLVESWIMQSFGERKKWEPWVKMIENLVTQVTGQEFSILTELSQLSSVVASPVPTS